MPGKEGYDNLGYQTDTTTTFKKDEPLYYANFKDVMWGNTKVPSKTGDEGFDQSNWVTFEN